MKRLPVYTVRVIGETWQGFNSAYEYTFDHEPTKVEIISKAGDFQSLADYQVYRTIHEGNWEFETIRREITRDWASEDSMDTWDGTMAS